jgi:hypothetical protein
LPENNDDEAYEKICREDLEFFGPPRAGERYISYRLAPEQRPSGLDVRFMVRVVSGDQAKHIDAVQAKAIVDLLRWCRDHREQQEALQITEAAHGAPGPASMDCADAGSTPVIAGVAGEADESPDDKKRLAEDRLQAVLEMPVAAATGSGGTVRWSTTVNDVPETTCQKSRGLHTRAGQPGAS